LTAAIVISVGLLLGVGLVVSQMMRLKEWLGKAPPVESPETEPTDPSG
jgi:hypothetical protein